MPECFLIRHPNSVPEPEEDPVVGRDEGPSGYLRDSSFCGAGDGTGIYAQDINPVLYALQSIVDESGVVNCDLGDVIRWYAEDQIGPQLTDVDSVSATYSTNSRRVTISVSEGGNIESDDFTLPAATATTYGLIRLSDIPNFDDDINSVTTTYTQSSRTLITQVGEGGSAQFDSVQLPIATQNSYGLIRLQDLPDPDDDITDVNTTLNANSGVLTTEVVEGSTTITGTVDLDPRIIRLQPNNQYFRADLANNSYTVNSGTPTGPRAGSTFSLPITIPADADGVEPMIEFHGGWRMTTPPNNANQQGEVNLRPQYRVDGGAWQQMNVNGDRNILARTDTSFLEQELFRSLKLPALSAGTHTIQFRTNINDNSLPAGAVITSYRQTGVVHFVYNRFV